MKRIDSSYKLIEFFSGKVVSAATVEFELGTVVLIEKLVFNDEGLDDEGLYFFTR